MLEIIGLLKKKKRALDVSVITTSEVFERKPSQGFSNDYPVYLWDFYVK